MLLPRSFLPSTTSSLLRTSVHPPLLPSRRALFSSELPEVPEPVILPFEVAEPKEGRRSDESLVIAHGLFGSKQNWRSLIKTFAQELGMPVYALDLRNHGTAPHNPLHTNMSMASDISQFFKTQNLGPKRVHLLGHSMGGKAVMTTTLHPRLNSSIKTLISVDIAPGLDKVLPEFSGYLEGMLEIEHNREEQSRAEADSILQKYEKDVSIRQFLLTNLILKNKKLNFRVPLETLKAAIPELAKFPFKPGEIEWDGPTLFIRGTQSPYINEQNLPAAKAFFPNMVLKDVNTGHWVQAERPDEFIKLVVDFVRAKGLSS